MVKTLKKSQNKTSSNRIGVAALAHSHYIRPWQVIVFIVLIMFAGLVIIRLSRAATSEVASTPVSENELQQLSPSLSSDLGAVSGSDMQTPSLQISDTVLLSYTPVGVPGVQKVGFYLDSKLVHVATKRPYNFTFNSTRYPNGQYMLTAVAFDSNNKPLSAVKKNLIINNDLTILQKATNIISYPFYVLTAQP